MRAPRHSKYRNTWTFSTTKERKRKEEQSDGNRRKREAERAEQRVRLPVSGARVYRKGRKEKQLARASTQVQSLQIEIKGNLRVLRIGTLSS